MKVDNPIIWKKENCLVGECTELYDKHWWSIPFSNPEGLVSECHHCGKSKEIKVERDTIKIIKNGEVKWEIESSIIS